MGYYPVVCEMCDSLGSKTMYIPQLKIKSKKSTTITTSKTTWSEITIIKIIITVLLKELCPAETYFWFQVQRLPWWLRL